MKRSELKAIIQECLLMEASHIPTLDELLRIHEEAISHFDKYVELMDKHDKLAKLYDAEQNRQDRERRGIK